MSDSARFRASLTGVRLYAVTALALLAGFYGLHWTSNLVPQTQSHAFVQQAFTAEILSAGRDRTWTGAAQAPGAGQDRSSDCRALLSVVVPPSASPGEAAAPMALELEDPDGQQCRTLHRIVAEGERSNPVPLNARYWHGAVAMAATLLHLSNFTLLQIGETIKAASYFAWMAFAVLALAHSRRLFAVLAPVALAGMFVSAISFYGSFSHGLPYLFAVLALAGLVRLMTNRASASVLRLCFFAAGMASSFLFLLDGHLILLVPVSLVILYFGREDADLREWALLASGCLGAFLAGFGLSHLVNQAGKVMVLGWDAVVPVFFGNLTGLFSTTLSSGEHVSAARAIGFLFNYGYLHTGFMGNGPLKAVFAAVSIAAFLLSAAVAAYLSWRAKSFGPAAGIIVVAVAVAAALARVGAMPSHSFAHALLIGRYMFVPLALALSGPVAAWRWRRPAAAAGPESPS